MKYEHISDKVKVALIEKICYQQWKCFHGSLHYGCTAKKIIGFGILVFLEAQEINQRGNFLGSKCDAYCMFLRELVSLFVFLSSLLFFEIFLSHHPVMFSTDFQKSIICSFTKKACKFAIKRDSNPKKFLEVAK